MEHQQKLTKVLLKGKFLVTLNNPKPLLF